MIEFIQSARGYSKRRRLTPRASPAAAMRAGSGADRPRGRGDRQAGRQAGTASSRSPNPVSDKSKPPSFNSPSSSRSSSGKRLGAGEALVVFRDRRQHLRELPGLAIGLEFLRRDQFAGLVNVSLEHRECGPSSDLAQPPITIILGG
jgi:hypothetical protein